MKKRIIDTIPNGPIPDSDSSISLNNPEKWKKDLIYYHSLPGAYKRKKAVLARKPKKKYLIWGLVVGFLIAFSLFFVAYLAIYGF